MTDRADYRDCGSGYRTDYRLVGEGQEVFQRTASAPDDDDVCEIVPVCRFKLTDQHRRGLRALNRCGQHDNADEGIPPAQYLEDIPHRGTGWTGDYRDPRRESGEGTFA